MPDLTEDGVRRVVREETSPPFQKLRDRLDGVEDRVDGLQGQVHELREELQDTRSSLNNKMDFMLMKMDGFLKGFGDEKDERLFGDAQLERRVERLEGEMLPRKERQPDSGASR